eukprot:1315359-Amphidinium_carterae.1
MAQNRDNHIIGTRERAKLSTFLASAGLNVVRLGAMMPGLMPSAPFNGRTWHIHYLGVSPGSEMNKLNPNCAHLPTKCSMIPCGKGGALIPEDSLSEVFCGEGLPQWVAREILDAFPADFEESVLELVAALTPRLPGLADLEEGMVR